MQVPGIRDDSRDTRTAPAIRKALLRLLFGKTTLPIYNPEHRGDVGTMIMPHFVPELTPGYRRNDCVVPITVQPVARIIHPYQRGV